MASEKAGGPALPCTKYSTSSRMPQPCGWMMHRPICTSLSDYSEEPFIRGARALLFRVWLPVVRCYALPFLYKLRYREEQLQLFAILPHRQDPTLDPRTKSQHHQSHQEYRCSTSREYQLCQELAPIAPN